MKKLFAILLLSTPAYAGLITHTDYTSGATITASGQNANENAIVNEFNGNIDNSNIKSGAAISVNKLAAGSANKLSITDNSGFISTVDNTVTSGSTITITGLTTFSTITFSPSTRGILGVTDASNASVGTVGEYTSSTTADTINYSGSTNFKDIIAIVLTAGDWDISAQANITTNAGVSTTYTMFIGTVAGNNSTGELLGINQDVIGYSGGSLNSNNFIQRIPFVRANISTTTTYYLKVRFDAASGTPQITGGIIQARRVR